MFGRHLFPLVLAVTLAVLPAVAGQQSLSTHTLTGVVTDGAGKPLAGVTVELTAPAANNSVRTTVTDGNGVYRIERVVPGLYVLEVRLSGFGSVIRDLEIGSGGDDFRFDVQLRPRAPGATAARRPNRRVICGMTVISPPPGATVYPGLRIPKTPAPPGTEVKPTIRAIQPTICWDSSTEPLPVLPKR